LLPLCSNSILYNHNGAKAIAASRQHEASLTLNIRSWKRNTDSPCLTTLNAVDKDESTKRSSLSNLGYTDEEIRLSENRELRQQPAEKLNVQVNLLPDIDSVTLTALGFALIAFNFFVLGNLEDGGIAGVAATIINTLSQ
jgi:hypothetical protein